MFETRGSKIDKHRLFFKRFVAIKIAVFGVQHPRRDLVLLGSAFFVLLGEQDSVDVWQNTTSGNGDSTQELVQFFVVSDGQLKMSWDDSLFLVVTGSVASQLQDFSRQVFQDGSQVDWSSGSNSRSIVSFSQESVHSADWKLQTSSE